MLFRCFKKYVSLFKKQRRKFSWKSDPLTFIFLKIRSLEQQSTQDQNSLGNQGDQEQDTLGNQGDQEQDTLGNQGDQEHAGHPRQPRLGSGHPRQPRSKEQDTLQTTKGIRTRTPKVVKKIRIRTPQATKVRIRKPWAAKGIRARQSINQSGNQGQVRTRTPYY